MLEPIAQYSRSLLVGERAARIGRAHAAAFLSLTERAAVGYEQADQVAWLARVEADEANILVAVERSLDLGDADTAGRITWAMWLYWWFRGRFAVGRRLAELCLKAELSPAVRPCVRLTAATMSYAGGDHPSAAAHWDVADALGRRAGEPGADLQGPRGHGPGRPGRRRAGAGEGALPRPRWSTACGPARTASGCGSLCHVWLGHGAAARG